jgi:hypothetical protein
MAINRGPGGSGDASNAASNASAIATVKAQEAAESAASALSSANNAAISASSASASASSATASASAASGSATTASSAASTATTQADIATTKASEASTSAANALTSETNAATSADLAEDWAIKTSGPVSGSEYSSKYHAGLASTSATSANDAKTAAEAARDATLAAYDQFDDRYLGTKTTDPTVDNDGNPLVAGSLYFNSVSGVMRLYTGSAWVAAYVSGTASSIAVTPAGNIASTNVQTALQELDGEKQPNLVSGTNIKTVNSTSLLGSGNITIDTTPAAGSITTAMLANNSVTSAKMANGGAEFGMRNRIINGAMQIDQRNAGASVTIPAATLTYTVDRWAAQGTDASKFTVQQNAGAVTPPTGFRNYLGATVAAAANVSLGSSGVYFINQKIEGFNIADFGWGAAGASTVTLSFWVRSSLTGTFGGSIYNSAADRSYPYTYTISSANTWEQKTVNIAGDTSGTWLTTNGAGMVVLFSMGYGTNFLGTANIWQSGFYGAPTGAVSPITTNNSTFYITGVQLEKGSTATAFEWRPYGTELALCQRYYWNMGTGNQKMIGMGAAYTTGSVSSYVQFPVTMRASPTLIQTTGTDYYVFERNGTTDGFNAFTGTFRASDTGLQMYSDSGLSGTAGHAGILWTNNNSSSIAFNIEL